MYVNYICPREATVETLMAATVPEWESALGENHFFIALWLEKCVKTAEAAEQYAIVETLYRKILVCWDATPYLSVHARQPRQIACLHGIGRACFAQGNYPSASKYFADCIKRTEAMVGQLDPILVVYLEDAAEAARQQGDNKMEVEYTKRAQWIRRYRPAAFSRPVGPNRNVVANPSGNE